MNKKNLLNKYIDYTKKEIPSFKQKNYSHFDLPFFNLKGITINNRNSLEDNNKLNKKIKNLKNYLNSPQKIAQHAFYPFIGFILIERKYSNIKKLHYYEEKLTTLEGDDHDKCKTNIEKLKKSGITKVRQICYSSHMDGYIYAYYASILKDKYEHKINELNLNQEVLAYRKLPPILIDGNLVKQNNITMARDIFAEIKSRNCKCYALSFDISGFFDSIDHKNLYDTWAFVLGYKKLPEDHFNIFKSLTKYCFVDLREICRYFNVYKKSKCLNHECEKCNRNIRQFLPKILFKSAKQFREFRTWYKNEYKFTDHNKFHINPSITASSNFPYGIPQGSEISALLSNIYMLPFDIEIKKLADKFGGVYRRYSDDIVFICPADKHIKEIVETTIHSSITKRGSALKIHPIANWDKFSKSQCYDFTSNQIKHKPMQYLGFYFDGEKVRIRDNSLAKYYRKSTRAVKAMKISAKKKLTNLSKRGIILQEKNKKLYRNYLYQHYTHMGKRNFISYAYRSFEIFDDSTIKKQVRRHLKKLNLQINIADQDILSLFNVLKQNKN